MIGIFDSGYGGLTILEDIRKRLPVYDYLYLGDNARAPYGSRSFDIVYDYTLQAVKELFNRGCHLVILACNTASAKALRSIQQKDLPKIDSSRRVLGVIRPTVESLPLISKSRHVGLLGTEGTVNSHSYAIELDKLSPEMTITEIACPMLVPLIENNETDNDGAEYFIKKYVEELLHSDEVIDTVVLGCTHYPLISDKIRKYIPENIAVVSQGPIVAESLADYLQRHPEIEEKCTKNSTVSYLTTEDAEKFSVIASRFTGCPITATHIGRLSRDCDNREKILEDIKKLLPEEAVEKLNSYLEIYPDDDNALTLRGMRHWSLGHRSLAINDYLKAISINPQSKSVMALKAANDILDYYNKDLLNP